MKALSVRYELVKSDGNWGNTRVGVEVEVEEGETAQQVLDRARAFVAKNMPDPRREHDLVRARRIVEDPDSFTGAQVKEARALLDRLGSDDDDLF